MPPLQARPEQLSDVGVVGLCSAGRALALRLAATGLRVALLDDSAAALEEFIAGNAATRGGLVGYANAEDFVESLNTPRRAMVFETSHSPLMVPLRLSWHEPDRLLQCPLPDGPVSSFELDLFEETLVFQLA